MLAHMHNFAPVKKESGTLFFQNFKLIAAILSAAIIALKPPIPFQSDCRKFR